MIESEPITIRRYGERAVLVEWPPEVNEAVLMHILRYRDYLATSVLKGEMWEYAAIYHSLTLISRVEIEDFEALKLRLLQAHKEVGAKDFPQRYLWELPVCYEDPELAPDLEEVARTLGMTVDGLVEAHCSHEYTVYGIGFLPGFLYLGGLPAELEIPRREHPRPRVDRGAVGLAAKQTGIYPRESPGGWNIIGNCPVPVFRVGEDPPVRLNLADRIKFFPVSRGEYDLHKLEAEVGIYEPKKTPLHA